MTLFATPDFGAAGIIVIILLAFSLLAFVATVSGFVLGTKKLKSESKQTRKRGLLLLVLSASVPFCCCFGPQQCFRLAYGSYPLGAYPNNKITPGMTREEVTAVLGPAHNVLYPDSDRESWYYSLDSFTIGYFGVIFGADGRVTGTHGN